MSDNKFCSVSQSLKVSGTKLRSGYVLAVLLLLFTGFFLWERQQPIDRVQQQTLQALVKYVAERENRTMQGVWTELNKTYNVRSYLDLKKAYYTEVVEKLSLRSQP